MKETDIQALMCAVVNDAGGFARKMNNRFLIGVSDLIVKLPDMAGFSRPPIGKQISFPAGFIEVKQRSHPATDAHFQLDVTHAQGLFLRDAAAAGMPCGVASFLQKGTGSGLTLWLHLMTWQTASYKDATIKPYTTHRRAHILLGRKGEREGPMLSALYNWQKEWREGK